MPMIPFHELPEHGRLWVFPASRSLTDVEAAECLGAVDDFLTSWSAHGAPLRSGRELRDNRFLLVGVDVDAESPSGCSIDALVSRLRAFGSDLGISLIDHSAVWYREGDDVVCVSRGEFKALVERRSVDARTPVFDTSLTQVSQLREGALERPAGETWHGKAFFGAHAPS